MENVDFRERLKEKMTAKKISIAKLARAADLNYGTVYYYLKGTSNITARNLGKLFDILNQIQN